MAFRGGFVSDDTKKTFEEYSDDTQHDLMVHSYNYHVDEAIASMRKLMTEFSEIRELYEKTRNPRIANWTLSNMYGKKRRQMFNALMASVRVLGLTSLHFEKDRKATEKISEVIMDIVDPEGVRQSEKMLELMLEMAETSEEIGAEELFD